MLLIKGPSFVRPITALTTLSFYYSIASPSSCDKETLVLENIPKIKLYQYQICPFCNRVKAYLDFLKIPYESIEVNPLTKSELSFSKEYKKVPIAIINDALVMDSQNIINNVTSFISLENKKAKDFFPPDTNVWSEWSEKKLAVYLYPNITRSFDESLESFNYVMGIKNWNILLKYSTLYFGAGFMLLANSKIKKKYGMIDERKELQDELNVWVSAVGNKKFLHGDNVTMPDIMVYGVLRSIEGLTAFNDIMKINDKLYQWYLRVDEVVRLKMKDS